MAPFKVFGLKGFVKGDVAALLGDKDKRHVEIFIVATSKKRARALLDEAWVMFLVLDLQAEQPDLNTLLADRHHLMGREGVYAYKKASGPADVLVELLPKGEAALAAWLAEPNKVSR